MNHVLNINSDGFVETSEKSEIYHKLIGDIEQFINAIDEKNNSSILSEGCNSGMKQNIGLSAEQRAFDSSQRIGRNENIQRENNLSNNSKKEMITDKDENAVQEIHSHFNNASRHFYNELNEANNNNDNYETWRSHQTDTSVDDQAARCSLRLKCLQKQLEEITSAAKQSNHLAAIEKNSAEMKIKMLEDGVRKMLSDNKQIRNTFVNSQHILKGQYELFTVRRRQFFSLIAQLKKSQQRESHLAMRLNEMCRLAATIDHTNTAVEKKYEIAQQQLHRRESSLLLSNQHAEKCYRVMQSKDKEVEELRFTKGLARLNQFYKDECEKELLGCQEGGEKLVAKLFEKDKRIADLENINKMLLIKLGNESKKEVVQRMQNLVFQTVDRVNSDVIDVKRQLDDLLEGVNIIGRNTKQSLFSSPQYIQHGGAPINESIDVTTLKIGQLEREMTNFEDDLNTNHNNDILHIENVITKFMNTVNDIKDFTFTFDNDYEKIRNNLDILTARRNNELSTVNKIKSQQQEILEEWNLMASGVHEEIENQIADISERTEINDYLLNMYDNLKNVVQDNVNISHQINELYETLNDDRTSIHNFMSAIERNNDANESFRGKYSLDSCKLETLQENILTFKDEIQYILLLLRNHSCGYQEGNQGNMAHESLQKSVRFEEPGKPVKSLKKQLHRAKNLPVNVKTNVKKKENSRKQGKAVVNSKTISGTVNGKPPLPTNKKR